MIKPLVLFLISCIATYLPAQEKPNIILFIADDVSYDDLGCYGNSFVKTPHIDSLATNGVHFDNMYLTASSCSPSRNSIITGRYPHNTGAAELHTEPPMEMVAFPEKMREKGYYTGLSGKFHMGQYAERAFDTIVTESKHVGDGGEEAWVSILKNRPRNQPFFLWYAAYDAHRNWGENIFKGTHSEDKVEVPEYLVDGKNTRRDLAHYYDEIARFDHYIGEVVEELRNQNELKNTIIIVMSDNGRPFPHSKTRLNDRGLKTPFVLHWPEGISSKGAYSGLVSVIDIAPTLYEVVDIPILDTFQGKSFLSILSNPGKNFRNYVFGEQNWHDYEAHGRMVRSERFLYVLNSRPHLSQMGPADSVGSPTQSDLDSLYIHGKLTSIQAEIYIQPRPSEEFYHLESDPDQYQNIATNAKYGDLLKKHREILKQWITETGDNSPKNLTKDWYEKRAGYIKTKHYGKRGEMPGISTNASKNNLKGPF